ncbi:MAG: zinc-ribbon domain-containing protein [Proteobacteria bacterium]|nr:zinc-ribbon domain-containing protein [Pseudomonadota bacterium]
MSLVTRCPACSTAFKVVRDQLRISEGWVRCGRCSQVFDATLDLQDSEDGVPNATTTLSPAPSSEAQAAAPDPASPDLVETVGAAPPSLDEDDFVEPDGLPMPAAPAASWPARDLLDLGFGPAPVALPAGHLLAESEAAQEPEISSSVSSSSTAEAAPAGASGWLSFPADLPAVVADEPWPLSAASRPPQDDATSAEDVPPSPVDQAVDAQLQKALRRARIQALRESRARARAEAEAEGRTQTTTADAGPASDTEVPAVPSEPIPEAPASVHEAATLRQASEEPPGPEAAVPAPALPSFLDVGAPIETSTKSPHRAALLTFAMLAALLLMFQVLRHERDALAAAQPGMRPVLAMLCQLSGCELSPVRRIDAIRIDGSSFTPERDGGGYRLLFSLRNASPTALAMPAIELSLLDGNERPVVRRVFQPAEFGAPAVLGPRAEHAATLALALKLPESGGVPPVVGYSLLAFYP